MVVLRRIRGGAIITRCGWPQRRVSMTFGVSMATS
jgi:hypothetical protein